MARSALANPTHAVADPPLYQALLGSAFESLPDRLRAFHRDLGTREGILTIVQGAGPVRGLAARLMRLPPPGTDVPILLHVSTSMGVETWDRTFGGHLIRTRQWAKAGLLIEQAGPLVFAFRVTCDGRSMSFSQRHCWLLGMPLPRPIAPTISALATGNDDGWYIEVVIALPLLGTITRYEGTIRCP